MPLYLCLGQLHEQTPFGDSGDETVELLIYLVGHEFHHFVFDRRPFGLGSPNFAFRRVFAEIFVILLVYRFAAVEIVLQQTVHHHVGVAADGRGEVGVIVERKTVVPYVVRGVDGFRHGA